VSRLMSEDDNAIYRRLRSESDQLQAKLCVGQGTRGQHQGARGRGARRLWCMQGAGELGSASCWEGLLPAPPTAQACLCVRRPACAQLGCVVAHGPRQRPGATAAPRLLPAQHEHELLPAWRGMHGLQARSPPGCASSVALECHSLSSACGRRCYHLYCSPLLPCVAPLHFVPAGKASGPSLSMHSGSGSSRCQHRGSRQRHSRRRVAPAQVRQLPPQQQPCPALQPEVQSLAAALPQ